MGQIPRMGENRPCACKRPRCWAHQEQPVGPRAQAPPICTPCCPGAQPLSHFMGHLMSSLVKIRSSLWPVFLLGYLAFCSLGLYKFSDHFMNYRSPPSLQLVLSLLCTVPLGEQNI